MACFCADVKLRTYSLNPRSLSLAGFNVPVIKVKVPPRAEAHRAALISVSVALSQTPD